MMSICRTSARKNIASLFPLAVFLAAPQISYSAALEEVIVTAQKRAQSVQDVGITVNAFSGDEMRELGVSDPIDVGAQMSNTQINYGFGLPVFSVRGQGLNEFASNTDSPVAVHVDEVYLSKSFQFTLGAFDIGRVEALKGPQGTLFGRNTTGGAINFFTNKPTEEFEAGFNAEYSRFDTVRGEGYVSGPLTDNLLGRVSGYAINSSDGPTKNAFDGDSLGERDEFALRLLLQWNVSEDTEVLFNLHGGVDKSEFVPFSSRGVVDANALPAFLAARGAAFGAGGPAAASAIPIPFCAEYLNGTVRGDTANCVNFAGFHAGEDDPYKTNQDNGGRDMGQNNDALGGSIRIDHELPWATLTSISAYEYFKRDTFEDTEGSPDVYQHTHFYNELNQYTQELRLTSNGDDALSWIVGFFYEHDNLDVFNTGEALDNPEPVTGFLHQSTFYNQKTDAVALFAHTEFQATDEVTLVAGARFTWERKEFDGATDIQLPFIPLAGEEARLEAPLARLAQLDSSRNDQNASFKLGINWTPEDDTLYYASMSTGFRSGGFSGGFVFSDGGFSSYDPELITAYEIGFKTQVLDNTLQLNGVIFHYDVTDLQVNADLPTAVLPQTDNADSGDTYGAELEAWWRPIDGLDLKAGLGWLDATYGDFTLNGVSGKGNEVINSPQWTFNGLIRYEFPITEGLIMSAMTDFNYRGERYLEPANSPISLQDEYWIVNARMAVASADEKWELAVWGKNIFDEEYLSFFNDVAGLGFVIDVWGMPATYGVSLDYKF